MVQRHLDQPCLVEVQMSNGQANEAAEADAVLLMEQKLCCFVHK